ncbi:MAG: HTH domain-containing protein, partial [Clostridia bacterium]
NDTVKANFDTVKLLGDTVIDLIKINNKITANEIAEKLKISLSTVKREIKKLKNSGEIERVGSDKKGQWNVLQN